MKKAKKAAAPVPKESEAEAAPAVISVGQSFPVCEGAAIANFTGGAIDGRYRGWICKSDGTRVERIMVSNLAEAESRAQQLVDKGAL